MTIMKALDWAYAKAIEGVPGSDSAEKLARSFTKRPGSSVEHCDALIGWQIAKACASGFVMSLGGLLTLPVSVPASISLSLYIQLRMIAAIAHIGGYDIRDDQVRSLVYLCLCGNAAGEVAKGVGIQLGMKLANEAVSRIPGQVLIQINKEVGFRLLTKFGQAGVLNLGQAIPLLGGLIGGALDGGFTRLVGIKARQLFVDNAATKAAEEVSA
jgi:hypothetical protein